MKLCKTCKNEIPPERLNILPDTEYCVVHSLTKPKRGFVEGSIKSKNCEVVILDGDDPTVQYWEERQHKY